MKTLASIPRYPGAWPLGNLAEFRDDRIGFQRRMLERCGDIGRFRIGWKDLVAVASGELAHELLVEKADAFIKSRGLQYARILLGDGLLTAEGDLHRRHRKLMSPAFQHRRIAAFADVMAEYTERAAGRWADGAEIALDQEMMKLTLEIVGKTLFDADVGGDAEEVGHALELAMRHFISEVVKPVHLPMWWPDREHRELRRALAGLDAIIYRIIRERRAGAADRGDVLSMLLLAQDEERAGLSDREVRDEAMTLFLAGHETTANALAWSFHHLGRHPASYARLRHEAQSVLGGCRARFEDLAQLPFAGQVLRESMRLHPPAYMVGRQAARPVELGGYLLPKGTIVFVSIHAMHRRADVFADPERFTPERFEGDRERQLPRMSYMPFGGGPRVCIGNHFALMEGQIILAQLAARLEFQPLYDREVGLDPMLTLRPASAIRMRVRRDRAALASVPPAPLGGEVPAPA